MLPGTPDSQGTSTRPYLLRALHDWCTDNGYTPYLAVFVGPGVQVPMEYVKNNEIVLNVGFEATSSLQLGNETIEFKARFGGVSREIRVPVDHVVAIYARENGQGMAFPVPTDNARAASPSEVQPLRGLRLASIDADSPVKSRDEARQGPKIDALRDAKANDDTVSTNGPEVAPDSRVTPDDPPEPAGPGSTRPTLKRIK